MNGVAGNTTDVISEDETKKDDASVVTVTPPASVDGSADRCAGFVTEEQNKAMKNELNQIMADAKLVQDEIIQSNDESKATKGMIRLERAKIQFQNYVQDKLDKISIRANIIRFKYSGYKKCFDFISVIIIVASAMLTFVEALKAEFDLEDTGISGFNTFFTVFPIVVSSGITVTAAVMKFKKYQEKMEALSRCIEKAIFTTYRLKRIQEQTRHAGTIEEINKLIQTYSGEPYDLYLKCQEEMEKCLKYEDLVRHMKTYFDLSLEYQQEEAKYQLSRMSIGLHQSRMRRDLRSKIEGNVWVRTWGSVFHGICHCICCCRPRQNQQVLRRMFSHYQGETRCRSEPARDVEMAQNVEMSRRVEMARNMEMSRGDEMTRVRSHAGF